MVESQLSAVAVFAIPKPCRSISFIANSKQLVQDQPNGRAFYPSHLKTMFQNSRKNFRASIKNVSNEREKKIQNQTQTHISIWTWAFLCSLTESRLKLT